jgi:hypothetical protein
MITIQIADVSKEWADADEQWINQQINMRRQDGQNVCVRITIKEGDLDMVLATAACGNNGSGGRAPRPKEKRVFELWAERELDKQAFASGNIVAFLKQLKHYL